MRKVIIDIEDGEVQAVYADADDIEITINNYDSMLVSECVPTDEMKQVYKRY